MRVLDTAQMREADRRTIDEVGIPARTLMENAGREVVAVLDDRFDDLHGVRVTVIAGRGNNGGDGFVVARLLAQRGIAVSVALLGRVVDVRGDARANLDALADVGVSTVVVLDEPIWHTERSHLLGADLVIDALFGTGLRGPLTGLAESVVTDLNASSVPVVSIDLPSGLSADTAAIPGAAVRASITVALGAPKVPHVLPPAEHIGGQLVVADIGIPAAVIEGLRGPRIHMLTADDMRPLVRPRQADAHKGQFGHVLIVAGSKGKTGAAVLAAKAALRSGAGLVTVATPDSMLPIVATSVPEIMTLGLAETSAGTIAAEAVDQVLAFQADVIAVGPGLGTGSDVNAFVDGLLRQSPTGLVLDADALNACVGRADLLMGSETRPVAITPHPGEMARLVGASTADVQGNRLDIARHLATTNHLHVILKGYRTVIASPGGDVALNMTGNPGMATGGSGDVLTGMVAAWFGQLRSMSEAARLAVFLHGLAGDLAADEQGEVSLTAGDIVEKVGPAVLDLTARRPRRGGRRA